MNDKSLIETVKRLIREHGEIVSYLFFGVCAMLVNMAAYYVLYELLDVGNVPATVLAWLEAVIFAFFTNKRWVFKSRRETGAGLLAELTSFFGCRVLTGALDVVIMAVAVDRLHGNGVLWKLISNVIVTVLNYVASKFFIFKRKPDKK